MRDLISLSQFQITMRNTIFATVLAMTGCVFAAAAHATPANWSSNSDGVWRLFCNEAVKANNTGRSVFDLANYTNAGLSVQRAMELTEKLTYCPTVGIHVW